MFDEEKKPIWRELAPLFAGILFGIGWWTFISAHIVQAQGGGGGKSYEPVIWAYFYVPGIVASFGLVMTNIVDVSSITGNSFMAFANPSVSMRVRAWLFVALFLHFGAIIAAVWIMAAIFLVPTNPDHQFPGIALALQTLAIFISSMMLLWNRSVGRSDYESL